MELLGVEGMEFVGISDVDMRRIPLGSNRKLAIFTDYRYYRYVPCMLISGLLYFEFVSNSGVVSYVIRELKSFDGR